MTAWSPWNTWHPSQTYHNVRKVKLVFFSELALTSFCPQNTSPFFIFSKSQHLGHRLMRLDWKNWQTCLWCQISKFLVFPPLPLLSHILVPLLFSPPLVHKFSCRNTFCQSIIILVRIYSAQQFGYAVDQFNRATCHFSHLLPWHGYPQKNKRSSFQNYL